MGETQKIEPGPEEERAEAAARLAEIRHQIGRLPGPSSTEIIRQERDKRTEHLYQLMFSKR
jgi:hypothetical protein